MSNPIDRRVFLRSLSAAGAALTVAGSNRALAAAATDASQVLATASPRAYGTQRHALSLGTGNAGWLQSAQGGYPSAAVVSEQPGADAVVRKHLASIGYENIGLSGGIGMPQGVYDWITHTLDRQPSRQDGMLMAVNADSKITSLLEFNGGALTEIAFPALDAGDGSRGQIGLTIAPDYTKLVRARNLPARLPAIPSVGRPKLWLTSNFRLRIDGLESACASISRIEPLIVRQPRSDNAVGEGRDYENPTAGPLEIPNLVLTLPEARADAFYDWFEDFVIRGNCGPEAERHGALELLSSNLRETLFTLTFSNLGIFRMTPVTNVLGMTQLKVEMYCEEMAFAASPGVAA